MSKFHYPFRAPWIITRGFDVRLDIYLDGRHGAIDIITDQRPTTGEPILAIADGICYPYPFLDKLSGYNCYVTHDGGWRSGYRHLRDLPHVAGAVKQGDVIGYADNTGLSTGPHLHFDLWNKTQQSPEAYLSSNGWWKHDPQVWLGTVEEDFMAALTPEEQQELLTRVRNLDNADDIVVAQVDDIKNRVIALQKTVDELTLVKK